MSCVISLGESLGRRGSGLFSTACTFCEIVIVSYIKNLSNYYTRVILPYFLDLQYDSPYSILAFNVLYLPDLSMRHQVA